MVIKSLITRGAGDSSVFIMCTVVSPPSWEGAVRQVSLVSSTLDVVHPDRSGSSAEVSPRPHVCCPSVAELSADDIAVVGVPEIVADGAPLTAVVDFNTTFERASSSNESYSKICMQMMNERIKEIPYVAIVLQKLLEEKFTTH